MSFVDMKVQTLLEVDGGSCVERRDKCEGRIFVCVLGPQLECCGRVVTVSEGS